MHEWALAEGVIDTALEFSEKEGFIRITRIAVRIGELQRIDPGVFRQALKTVMPANDPRLASTEVELTVEPASFTCRKCGRGFTLAEVGGDLDADQLEAIHFIPELAHGFLGCPRCESPDFVSDRGRDLWLETLEGER